METWKDIPGYEGLYQASSSGLIRSVDGKQTSNSRYSSRHWRGKVLKGRGKQASGYRVSLWKDGVPSEYLTHRLIALTFLGDPPDGYTVNHRDGNRFNNNVENLEWVSVGDNIRYGFEHGQYSTQKQITICARGKAFAFRSYSECDRFLGRSHGYTSGRLKKGKRDLDGYDATYAVLSF